jgi:hypothetical protein
MEPPIIAARQAKQVVIRAISFVFFNILCSPFVCRLFWPTWRWSTDNSCLTIWGVGCKMDNGGGIRRRHAKIGPICPNKK